MTPKIEGGGCVFKNRQKKDGEITPDYRGDGALTISLPDQEIELKVSLGLWKRQDRNGNTYLALRVNNLYVRPETTKEAKPPADKDELPF